MRRLHLPTPDAVAFTFDPVALARMLLVGPEAVHAGHRRVLKCAVIGIVLALLSLFFGSLAFNWQFHQVWRYETAGLLGAAVGIAELLSRYRDSPSFVLLSAPGIGYVVINATASLGAMALVIAFGWKFGAKGDASATQVLVAGFGAMALFRSSLLTVKAGNEDVGIGPSSILSIMMAASDRSADRLGAADRAGRVRPIMEGIDYQKAREPLPTVAVALMQNLSSADVVALNADLEALKGASLPEDTKALLLGLKLTNVVSTAVLAAAKDSLGQSILVDAQDPPARRDAKQPDGHATTLLETVPGFVEVGASSNRGPASTGLPQTPQTPSPHDNGGGSTG